MPKHKPFRNARGRFISAAKWEAAHVQPRDSKGHFKGWPRRPRYTKAELRQTERSMASLRGWETRRENQAKARRSEASRKGWETRRKRQAEKIKPGADNIREHDSYLQMFEFMQSKEVEPGTLISLDAGDIYQFSGKVQDLVLPYLRVQFDAWSLLNEGDDHGYWRGAFMWNIKAWWPAGTLPENRADTPWARIEVKLNPDYREEIAASMEIGKRERVSFV